MNRKRAGIIAGLMLVAGLAGCGTQAPAAPSDTYVMPDGSNVSETCDPSGNRIIVVRVDSEHSFVSVVQHDPTCVVGAE